MNHTPLQSACAQSTQCHWRSWNISPVLSANHSRSISHTAPLRFSTRTTEISSSVRLIGAEDICH